jgi:hypothetical protein
MVPLKKISILTIVLIAFTANARIIGKFPGWDKLKADSQYIAVVRCANPIPAKANVLVEGATESDSEIQIVFTLKGTNNVSSPNLLTDHELSSGQKYLVFGYFNNDAYCAYERFRVVPLDRFFSTHSIAGLPFDEQVDTLLKSALEKAKRQEALDQEEEQRLEDAFKK